MEERADKPTSASSDDDDVLREQKFKRPQGLNLDSFMVGAAPEPKEETPVESPPSNEPETDSSDAAVGEAPILEQREGEEVALKVLDLRELAGLRREGAVGPQH